MESWAEGGLQGHFQPSHLVSLYENLFAKLSELNVILQLASYCPCNEGIGDFVFLLPFLRSFVLHNEGAIHCAD